MIPGRAKTGLLDILVARGKRSGVPTDMADRLKTLERANPDLRQANEIPRKGFAYFAQIRRSALVCEIF